jgi:hypothetical protein
MAVLLWNVFVDIFRSENMANGATDPAQPHLRRQKGHITRYKDSPFSVLSTSALRAEYELYFDPDVDIQRGDVVTNIIRIATGRLWLPGSDTEQWRVIDVSNSSPGFLEYRDTVLGRYIYGGPVQ